MAEPDDSDSLPTQQWSSTDDAAPVPSPRLSDSAFDGMLGANSPVTRGGWQPPTPEELQARLPQYEIANLLGRGGMGAVYKGWQRSLERFVAIKILPPGLESGDVDFAGRFKREAKAMAKLKHPGIIPVHDAGETADGLLYFVMDFVEGTDLQKMLAARGKLPPEEALPITSRVLEALAYAHQRGIIHRDIKPANIMVDDEGQVLVADFGLARSTAPDSTMLTVSNMSMGTPDFMAPESHLGMDQVDHRADLYAVGVMLYQMLTGKLPRGRFDPPSRAVPGLDKRLDVIVDRTLQNERDARYSSAIELKTALEPVLTRTIARRTSAETAKKRSLKKPLLISALAIALVVVAFIVLRQSPPAAKPPTPEAAARKLAGVDLAEKPTTPPPRSKFALNYPPGQWVKVWQNPEAIPNVGEVSGGWATLVPSVLTARIPDATGKNWVLRARFRRGPGGTASPQLQLRNAGGAGYNVIPISRELHLRRNDPSVPTGNVVLKKLAISPHTAGQEFVLEIAAIGRTLVGRLDGNVVSVQLAPTDHPDLAGELRVVQADVNAFCDVEVLNLDGLPEAEARKLAGVDGRAVFPTPLGAPSGGDGSPSRPGALGESATSLLPDRISALAANPANWVNHLQTRRWDGAWVLENGVLKTTDKAKAHSGSLATMQDGAVRVRARAARGSGLLMQLILRSGGAVRDKPDFTGTYRFQVNTEWSACTLGYSERHKGVAATETHEYPWRDLPLPAGLTAKGDTEWEFRAIGDELSAWVNGQLIKSIRDSRVGGKGLALLTSDTGVEITRVETIDFASLPEAEAWKLVGAAANAAGVPSAAAPSYPQPSEWRDVTSWLREREVALGKLKVDGEWLEVVQGYSATPRFGTAGTLTDVVLRASFSHRIGLKARRDEGGGGYLASIEGREARLLYTSGGREPERLATVGLGAAYQPDAVHEVVFAVQDAQLRLWLDGQLVATASDNRLKDGQLEIVAIADGKAPPARIRKVEYGAIPLVP